MLPMKQRKKSCFRSRTRRIRRLLMLVVIAGVFGTQLQLLIPNSSDEKTSSFAPETTKKIPSATNNDLSQTLLYNHTATSSRFAYASIIGGVDPSRPSYRGFLYNILVTAHLLRHEFGSTADFVLLVQLSVHVDDDDVLPANDLQWLHTLRVHVVYLPKSIHQSFYDITLQKFRILQLIHYQRVLFLDADVMPLANLDYLMELSTLTTTTTTTTTSTQLQENLIVAGSHEPSTAGFFMLAPGPGKWEQLCQVIQQREIKAQHLAFPKFDVVHGWGHVIPPNDPWHSLKSHGHNWTFYAADADQGLLYEWTKFTQQRVSIVIGNRLEQWVPPSFDAEKQGQPYPVLRETILKPFQNATSQQQQQQQQQRPRRLAPWARGPPPYCHFYHFTGRSKPWEGPLPYDDDDSHRIENDYKQSPQQLWFHYLLQLNAQLNMFDANQWEQERLVLQTPPLGRFHVKADMANRVDRTIHHNQQQHKRH